MFGMREWWKREPQSLRLLIVENETAWLHFWRHIEPCLDNWQLAIASSIAEAHATEARHHEPFELVLIEPAIERKSLRFVDEQLDLQPTPAVGVFSGYIDPGVEMFCASRRIPTLRKPARWLDLRSFIIALANSIRGGAPIERRSTLARREPSAARYLTCGCIVVDVDAHQVCVAGALLEGERKPTAKEFDLLVHLLEHKEKLVQKADIVGTVLGGANNSGANAKAPVCLLRKKLGAGCVHITTVRGKGYKMTDRL